MRGETWSLIGLKHIVGPAVLGGEDEIRVQNASRIVNKLELRVRRATGAFLRSASNAGSTVHLAGWRVADDNVAHSIERRVHVAQIVRISQGYRRGLNGSALSLPIRGLNVVMRGGCRRDSARAVGSSAQTLKKIVRGAILLKDYHDVLKV